MKMVCSLTRRKHSWAYFLKMADSLSMARYLALMIYLALS
jgi:hypothetical protein